MVDFYEETIQFLDLKEEEIESYFVNEKLSESEKILFLFKKGQPIQKEFIVEKIPYYLINKNCLELLILLVVEYIEILNYNIQLSFSKSIIKIFESTDKQTVYHNTELIINPIINITLKLICTTHESISKEYIKVFEALVTFYSNFKKVKISEYIIEMAVSLGSFGKSIQNRRLSVYFCCGLIRIAENTIDEMLSRILILSHCSDRPVKLEWIHNIKYIVKDFEESVVRKTIYEILFTSLEEENEYVLLEVVNTSLEICNYFPDKRLVEKINSTLKSQFNTFVSINNSNRLTYSFEYNEIFLGMIKFTLNYSENKIFIQTIHLFIETFITSNGKETNEKINLIEVDLIIDNFEKICDIMKETDDVRIPLMQFILENLNLHSTKLMFNNLKVFLQKLDEKYVFKKFFPRLFAYLEEPTEENKILILTTIDNYETILNYLHNTDNEDLIKYFKNIFPKIDELLSRDGIQWRHSVKFLLALKKTSFYLRMDEKMTQYLFTYTKRQIKRENFQIQIESIRLCVNIIKNSKENLRKDIIEFIKGEIIENKSFFMKRLFFEFISEFLHTFSVHFFKEIGLIRALFNLLDVNDALNKNILINKSIQILIKIYPVIKADISLNSEFLMILKLLKANSKDYEILKSINEFEGLVLKENNFNNFVKSDLDKYIEEKKYFDSAFIYTKSKNNHEKMFLNNPTIKKKNSFNLNSSKSPNGNKKFVSFGKLPQVEKKNTINVPLKLNSSKSINKVLSTPIKQHFPKSPIKSSLLSDSNLLSLKERKTSPEFQTSNKKIIKDISLKKQNINNYKLMVNDVVLENSSANVKNDLNEL